MLMRDAAVSCKLMREGVDTYKKQSVDEVTECNKEGTKECMLLPILLCLCLMIFFNGTNNQGIVLLYSAKKQMDYVNFHN